MRPFSPKIGHLLCSASTPVNAEYVVQIRNDYRSTRVSECSLTDVCLGRFFLILSWTRKRLWGRCVLPGGSVYRQVNSVFAQTICADVNSSFIKLTILLYSSSFSLSRCHHCLKQGVVCSERASCQTVLCGDKCICANGLPTLRWITLVQNLV